MFRAASLLLPEHAGKTPYQAVLLDEAQLQMPEGIQSLRTLLRSLKKAGASEIVWLSNDFPRMDFQQSEAVDGSREIEAQASWVPTQGERNKLAWMLENQQVFLTQYGIQPQHINGVDYQQTLLSEQGWKAAIPAGLRSRTQQFRLINTRFPYRVYPFGVDPAGWLPLIWYDGSNTLTQPSLVLSIYSQLSQSRHLHWDESGVISLDSTRIRASESGYVLSYFSGLTGRHSQFTRFSLENALKMPASHFSRQLVILGQDMQQIQMLADSLASLENGLSYAPPENHSVWQLALLVVTAIYGLWILPKVSRNTGVVLGALLLVGCLSMQLVLLLVKASWFTTVPFLLLLIGIQVGVYIYLSARLGYQLLQQKQQQLYYEFGHYQFHKGDYEAALSHLLKSGNADNTLADLYEIGLSFERKRQYERALNVYMEIDSRQKNYKDVDRRLQSMTGFAPQQRETPTPFQSQKTLVMPELEMPEFGRYKIEKELGRGAMGVVYLGLDPKINRQVAIKTLDYSQFSENEVNTVKSRFFREAEAAGRLSHNQIVTVYDVGEEEGLAFIAMDYVKGVPLSNYTRDGQLLPLHDVYQIIQSVAEALDYAHSQNIVHRDIKPGNIMYNPESRQIKITDFGIARITDSVKTRTGSFMGSPSYMAPEQMSGSRVDGRADLYALGVSFYQLLTGKLPFEADSLGNLAFKITNEKHRPVRDLRPDLPGSATRIVNKALQKDPEKRYQTGQEMAVALSRGLEDLQKATTI